MLGKLLKYDFRALFKKTWFVFPAIILLSLFAWLMSLLSEHYSGTQAGTVVSLFSGLSMTAAMFMIIFAVVFAYIACIIRFIGSMTRDEAYLTHTLPVSPMALVASKIISSFVVLLSVVAVSVGGGFLVMAKDGIVDAIGEIFTTVFPSVFGASTGMCIFMAVLFAVIYLLYYLTMVYACVSLGQMHSRGKIGFAFMYGGIIYLISQICSLIYLFAVLGMSIDDNAMPTAFIGGVIWYSIIFTGVLVIAFIVTTFLVFSKRKNLE